MLLCACTVVDRNSTIMASKDMVLGYRKCSRCEAPLLSRIEKSDNLGFLDGKSQDSPDGREPWTGYRKIAS